MNSFLISRIMVTLNFHLHVVYNSILLKK